MNIFLLFTLLYSRLESFGLILTIILSLALMILLLKPMSPYQSLIRELCQKYPYLAILAGFLCFSILLVTVAGPLSLFIAYINGTEIEILNQLGTDKIPTIEDIRFVLILEGWTQIVTWGLAGIMMMRFLGDEMNNIEPQQLPLLPIGIFMMLCAVPVAQFVAFDAESFRLPSFMHEIEKAIELREDSTNGLIKALLSDKSIKTLVLNILVLAVIPSVCEEIFFRNFILKRLLLRYSPVIAIVVSSIIFSAAHFQFYGFFSRMILGAVLGYLFYLSKSIVPGILAHFSYNAAMLFAVYAADVRGLDLDKDVQISTWIVVMSVALLYFLGRIAMRYQHQEIEE